jgi:O-methyltransferase
MSYYFPMGPTDFDNETRRALLRQLRNSPIEARDAASPQAVNIPSATYSPWVADAAFARVYAEARQNTLVDVYRCYELWTVASRLAHVPGDVLEVGTRRGGTGSVLAAACARTAPDKIVYLCDTFAGVVKAGTKTRCTKGVSTRTLQSPLCWSCLRSSTWGTHWCREVQAGRYDRERLGVT